MSEELVEQRLKNILNERYLQPLERISKEKEESKTEILRILYSTLETENKEKCLLLFRRGVEMLVRVPLIVTTIALSSNSLISIRDDNILQFVDNRYYSDLKLSSFLDLFKVETKDFKSIQGFNSQGNAPHIGLILNYIFFHYNTTFTRFINRNMEYFYLYNFFYENGEKIKNIINYLNSYHFSLEDTNEELYKKDIKEIQCEIKEIIFNLEKVLKKV